MQMGKLKVFKHLNDWFEEFRLYQSAFIRCPLYPQKRTLISTAAMSALCQKRTHAVQQT